MQMRTIGLGVLIAVAQTAPLQSQIPLAEYAARRESLGRLTGDGAIVVLGSAEPVRDFDGFSQSPHHKYLTGWDAPDAALLVLRAGGTQREMLFVAEKNPAVEVWTGVRPSLPDAQRMSGIPARVIGELTHTCDSLLAAGAPLRIVGEFAGDASTIGAARTRDQVFMDALKARHGDAKITDANRAVLELRGTKSPAEIELLRGAIAITGRAHQEAMRMVTAGWNEFEVQALIDYTFRRNGADRNGFFTAAASGDNTTTLHYSQNDRPIQQGELLLLDIGAAFGGYSADVTRTIPVGGTFSPAQRAIYELVRRAQVAGERAVRIGAATSAPQAAAADTIAQGLAALGLVESPTATYDCDIAASQQCPQWRLYYMHGLSHGIGLDVHDPDLSYGGTYGAGSVVTIEPGVYVRRTMQTVLADTPRNRAVLKAIAPALARYAGIGVRIEDDYLLTSTGLEWLSQVPREVAEVEAALKAPRAATPSVRDPAMVGRYRRSLP